MWAVPVPQRVLKKIGPNAQVPHSEYKPSVSLIPVSGPSILVDTLRAVPEAIVGEYVLCNPVWFKELDI